MRLLTFEQLLLKLTEWVQKGGIYPLHFNMFRCHDFAILVENADANSEQSAHKPTLGRKKQMTSTEQGQPGNFQLNEASTFNGSTMALFDSPTISSDEPKAFTSITLTASTNKIVLTAILSPLTSITKKSQIIRDLLDLVQKRL